MQMDRNGNKVQTLLQQFEGMSSKKVSSISIMSSTTTPNGMAKGTTEVLGKANPHTQTNTNNNDIRRSPLLKTGNRRGYIESKSRNSLSSATPATDNMTDRDRDPSAVPSLRTSHRNGIYVSNSITLHSLTTKDKNDNLNSHNDVSSVPLRQYRSSKVVNPIITDALNYGKAHVKRSNAFRQKDILDSIPKTKLVLERVKSLDAGTGNGVTEHIYDDVDIFQSGTRTKSTAIRASSVRVRPHDRETKSLMPLPLQTTKAVNVVTPYQVSDIYSQSQTEDRLKAPLVHERETPEYAVPFPIISRNSANSNSTEKSRSPAPPKYPPPPPVYKSQTRPYSCNPPEQKSIVERRGGSVDSGRGPPPEKPPRTFLYDILSDNQHQQQQQQRQQQQQQPKVYKTESEFYSDIAGKGKGPVLISKKNGNEEISNISTATIRQTGRKGHPHGPRALTPNNPLVRSKTESQIVVRANRRPVNIAEAQLGIPLQLHMAANGHSGQVRNSFSHYQSHLGIDQQYGGRVEQQSQQSFYSNPGRVQQNGNGSGNYGRVGVPPVRPARNNTKLGSSIQLNSGNPDFFTSGLPKNSHDFSVSRLHSNSLMYVNNLLSMSLQGGSGHVNRCASEDQLLANKSKSEWTLTRIGNDGEGDNANGRRNTVSNISSLGSRSIATPTGHPSLESTVSSHSSGKLRRTGIQQSIQNIVNLMIGSSKDATSTDSGIQLGSESLSSCDTPVGDSTTDTGDSDIENDVETTTNVRQVIEARKGYIRRVSSIRIQEIPSHHWLILGGKRPQTGESLFECLLVVGLNRDPYTGVYHPYIRDKFPPNAKLADGVEKFCFPDSLEWPCHEGVSAQSYTLAITDSRGARKYGCCFRILPEGANICIPITYCLISSYRAIGFYREVLKEITKRHGYSEFQKRLLMEDLYKKPFPPPSGNVTVQDPIQDEIYHNIDCANMAQYYNKFAMTSPKSIILRRKADQRLEEGDLVTLLATLDLTTIMKIFGSLLLERKVVLVSRALNTLSLCVEAFESMLYPFSWQHTFVPILPLNMTDVLDAPAPFLIGVLKSSNSAIDKTLDEGIVVDLDQNKVMSCVGDEGSILPKRIHRKVKDALQFVLNLADQKDSTKNALISECFIRMFVETLGNHSSYCVVQQDGQKIFERESFIKSCDSKATQNFLEWFSETSMFHEFIELRLKGNPPPGLFEQRIMEQTEQSHPQHGNSSGTPMSFKSAKLFMKGSRPFGSWLKETFVK